MHESNQDLTENLLRFKLHFSKFFRIIVLMFPR